MRECFSRSEATVGQAQCVPKFTRLANGILPATCSRLAVEPSRTERRKQRIWRAADDLPGQQFSRDKAERRAAMAEDDVVARDAGQFADHRLAVCRNWIWPGVIAPQGE